MGVSVPNVKFGIVPAVLLNLVLLYSKPKSTLRRFRDCIGDKLANIKYLSMILLIILGILSIPEYFKCPTPSV